MGYYAELELENEVFYEEKSKPTHYTNHYNGLVNWVQSQPLAKTGKNNQQSTYWDRIIERYATEALRLPDCASPAKTAHKHAKEISTNHFKPFTQWVKQTYK